MTDEPLPRFITGTHDEVVMQLWMFCPELSEYVDALGSEEAERRLLEKLRKRNRLVDQKKRELRYELLDGEEGR